MSARLTASPSSALPVTAFGHIVVLRFRRAIDPTAGPLLAARLVRFGPEDHALAIVIHHLAYDGASQPILLRDLCACYRARRLGRSHR